MGSCTSSRAAIDIRAAKRSEALPPVVSRSTRRRWRQMLGAQRWRSSGCWTLGPRLACDVFVDVFVDVSMPLPAVCFSICQRELGNELDRQRLRN